MPVLACNVGRRMTEVSFAQFIEALEVNTTLTAINLHGISKLFHAFRYNSFCFLFGHWFTIFVFELFSLENKLGDDGAKYLAHVLKVNTTLTSISMQRKSFFGFVGFFFGKSVHFCWEFF